MKAAEVSDCRKNSTKKRQFTHTRWSGYCRCRHVLKEPLQDACGVNIIVVDIVVIIFVKTTGLKIRHIISFPWCCSDVNTRSIDDRIMQSSLALDGPVCTAAATKGGGLLLPIVIGVR